MSTDALVIPCPHCHSLNRVPATRLVDQPQCGRCKKSLLVAKPFALDESNFSSQIKGDLPLLLDVWASWCGPCRSFAPTFEQAAQQLQGRCCLAKLDSEAHPQLSTRLGIRSIPSLILFRNGQEVARQSGALPLPNLLAWLKQLGIAG